MNECADDAGEDVFFQTDCIILRRVSSLASGQRSLTNVSRNISRFPDSGGQRENFGTENKIDFLRQYFFLIAAKVSPSAPIFTPRMVLKEEKSHYAMQICYT